jgi:hypothetical protein
VLKPDSCALLLSISYCTLLILTRKSCVNVKPGITPLQDAEVFMHSTLDKRRKNPKVKFLKSGIEFLGSVQVLLELCKLFVQNTGGKLGHFFDC